MLTLYWSIIGPTIYELHASADRVTGSLSRINCEGPRTMEGPLCWFF